MHLSLIQVASKVQDTGGFLTFCTVQPGVPSASAAGRGLTRGIAEEASKKKKGATRGRGERIHCLAAARHLRLAAAEFDICALASSIAGHLLQWQRLLQV
jgi:hypothetical protein